MTNLRVVSELSDLAHLDPGWAPWIITCRCSPRHPLANITIDCSPPEETCARCGRATTHHRAPSPGRWSTPW